MLDKECLNLDQVAGDFVDWFSIRNHLLGVRQAKLHYELLYFRNNIIKQHFEKDVERLFGNPHSFYVSGEGKQND